MKELQDFMLKGIPKIFEFPCEKPVTYDNILKTLKVEASLAHLPFASFKLGMHSLRRGPVTKAVNSGTVNLDIQKLMRVQSLSMVDHYSEADHQFLFKTSKSAF